MIYGEFLDRLAKLKGFEWFLHGGQIRAHGRKSRVEYCPITALAKVVSGEDYHMGEHAEAATALHLNVEVASSIVDAADDRRVDVKHEKVKIIRAQLLQVTGLAC